MRNLLTRALVALLALSMVAPAAAQTVTGGTILTQDSYYNFTPANMATWNRAKARVRSGTADATIAFVGDSTTVGFGAGDDPVNNFTNARNRAMPFRVAQTFTAMGLAASAEAVFGGNTIDSGSTTLAKLPLYNPQLTIASSGTTKWFLANEYSLGGRVMRGAGAASDLYSLTPSMAFDTIEVWYAGGFAGGSFTVDIGGAVLQTLTTTSGSALTKATIPTGGAAAISTVNIKNTGGQMVRLIGVVLRNSTLRRAQVLNLGWQGGRTGDWASASASAVYSPTGTATWAPEKALTTLAPDLTVIKLGANDLAAPVPVATSQANLQTIITAAKSGGGSCVLVTPSPQNPTTRDPAGLAPAYNLMLRDLALANGCGLIDMYARDVSWTVASTLGYFADDVHKLPVGYSNEGDFIARALLDS